MVKRLFFRDKQPIGIDISQTGIKVMAINPKALLVEGYGSVDLDPAKMQEALESTDPASPFLTDSIKGLMRENIVGSLPSNHAVIGVPASKAFTRTFTLPIEQEKKLSDAIEVEVGQYIPLPRNALYVDYEIIERRKKDLLVIMSALPKTIVDSTVHAVENAGLRPVMVEPAINAVARMLKEYEGKNLTTLIVDIGQATTDIAILDNGAIRISSGVNVGGNSFTIAISRHLSVTLENAHQLKVINGLMKSPRQAKLHEALSPSLLRITAEIRKILRYYKERVEQDSNIDQALIVGAGSSLPGIGEFFTNDLVMPSRVASPWQRLDFGSLSQPAKQFRPRYISVSGLASVNQTEMWK
ncbi:pilus assembly protein PilM [Candidatus Saccharibacteria bacterium]|nr:MAG: pilus assembly protein PilM [Candidatus Saccharibacteria bacterium]